MTPEDGTPHQSQSQSQVTSQDDAFIVAATTQYDEGLVLQSQKLLSRKMQNGRLALIAASVAAGFFYQFSEDSLLGMLITFALAVLFTVLFLLTRRSNRKRSVAVMEEHPHLRQVLHFYQDHIDIDSTSDRSAAHLQKRYTEIENVLESDALLLLHFGKVLVCVEKATVSRHLPVIQSLLMSQAKKYDSPSRSIHNTPIQMPERKICLFKSILLVLFIISLTTPYLSLLLTVTARNMRMGVGYMPEEMWRFFLLLPIPLASLILGIVCLRKGFKATKNVVVGILFSVLLIVFGSFTFIFSGYVNHDYAYVHTIEDRIRVPLPDTGLILTEDWHDSEQSAADSFQINLTSSVKFTDLQQISQLDSDMQSGSVWQTSLDPYLLSMVPLEYQIVTRGYDAFLIYNSELHEYNTVPEKGGTYPIIYLAYQRDRQKLRIIEYEYAYAPR